MNGGENFDAFNSSELTKEFNLDSQSRSIWENENVLVSSTIKENLFEFTINGESILSYVLIDMTSEKGFPSTPIQLYFTKKGAKNTERPIIIDNQYIGTPRNSDIQNLINPEIKECNIAYK